jgi:large subunit ribosomal protein L10
MLKQHKIEYGKGVAAELKDAKGIIVTGYKGLNFTQMDNIRRSIKGGGNDFRVIKNTILKKALKSCDIDKLDEFLVEPTAMVIVHDDFAKAAKEIKKYSKDYPLFAVKAGYMDGNAISASDVTRIADLPSREELLAKMLGSMNAPVQNFVSVLANVPRAFLNVLNAIKDQKDA